MTIWEQLLNFWQQYHNNIITLLIVIATSLLIYRPIKKAILTIGQKRALPAPLTAVMQVSLRWFLTIIIGLTILAQTGVLGDIWSGLVAVVAAVAIGFVAGWSLLSNTFSILLILIYRPFKIGEFVEIPSESISGTAVDVNIFFTTLQTEAHKLITVPNNLFFSKPVICTPGDRVVTLYDQLKADAPFHQTDPNNRQ